MKRARDSHPDAAWLGTALRDQAQTHDADLERITARFERLTADGTRRSPRRRSLGPMRVRLIGVPLGILAVLASATVAVAVSVELTVSTAPRTATHVTTPASVAAPTTTGAGAGPPPKPNVTHSKDSKPSPAPSITASTGSGGPLTGIGTVDSHSTQYWAQEDLTVTTTRPVTELRLTVTVSGGTSVTSTGSWSTILSTDVDMSVITVPSGLEYEFTLKPGQQLQPAAYGFGFQFDRPASGHNFALDTYSVSATDTGGITLSASGTFGH